MNELKEWWLFLRLPHPHPIVTNEMDWNPAYIKSDKRRKSIFDDQNVLLKNVVFDNRKRFNVGYVAKVLNNI